MLPSLVATTVLNVSAQETSTDIDWPTVLGPMLDALQPMLPWLILLAILLVVIMCPLPGRGPGSRKRDPWRGFKFESRRVVLARSGNRCEAALLIVVGRCGSPAEEVDHLYPWSKGGATVVSNGQALCKRHNRSKSNLTPPWWYVLCLERRRRKYFPAGEDVRVLATMSPSDREARASWSERKRTR